MTELVMFPDTDTIARKIVLQGLAEHGVTGIAVGTKLPSPMQNRFIRCYTIPGHAVSRRTQWCQVIVQVYDTKGNDVRCQQLARLVTAVLRAAPDTVIDGEQPISEPCEIQGPFPYEDPDMPGIPRYQATVTWTVQSTATS
jgi:hypothetical protein